MRKQQTWVVAQLGAREHYGIPRSLDSQGVLRTLLTDAWAPPKSLWSLINRRAAQRFHGDLKRNVVQAWTVDSVIFEVLARGRGLKGWDLTIARNNWFQRHAVAALDRLVPFLDMPDMDSNEKPTLFSYSYCALSLFQWAKKQGWRTVLGQIDPGEYEDDILRKIQSQNANTKSSWSPAPAEYWDKWRKECDLADRIIVNSEWSRQALVEKEIDNKKIATIPLMFEIKNLSSFTDRKLPKEFTASRPLRVLFLGQIIIRKGIIELFDAIALLKSEHVIFYLVGPSEVEIPKNIESNPKVQCIGAVTREDAAMYYRVSDIFILPTHSDGFGLTQLEALAFGLPLIVSRNCGEVVVDGSNGVILEDINGKEIAKKILYLLKNPDKLELMRENCKIDAKFSKSSIGKALISL